MVLKSMPCECTLAGFCARHQVAKSQAWVALCQSRPEYFQLWEAQRGPGQPISEATRKASVDRRQARLDLYHELWAEVHSKQDTTEAWFADWCRRVPNEACGCRNWLRDYLLLNPPRYDDWPAFSSEMHHAVTKKLGKPRWTGDDFYFCDD